MNSRHNPSKTRINSGHRSDDFGYLGQQWFGLMDFPLTRGLLTGVWGSWETASPSQVEAFLRRWRYSRFGLFQSAYAALHDLVLGAWYGQPEAWAAIGYPGPPAVN